MKQGLFIVQIIVSIVLIGLILVQARGTGFGRGGGFGSGASFSRRGLERFIFKMTFVFAVIFILIAIISLLF